MAQNAYETMPLASEMAEEESINLEQASSTNSKGNRLVKASLVTCLLGVVGLAVVAVKPWNNPKSSLSENSQAFMEKAAEEGQPFMLPHAKSGAPGTCAGDAFTDGGVNCEAPWVYCTDAVCDQKQKLKNGVLVVTCQCWMPTNTMWSIAPKETSGAGCVYNKVKPGSYPFSSIGGKGMCEEMKAGKLISTYGPLGTAPTAAALKCAPKTPWAWCWGAPCEKAKDGKVYCDCPVVVSDYPTPQYVSLQKKTCEAEGFVGLDKCKEIANGSPAGGSPMFMTPQCPSNEA